jgi:predicted outer membrane repeat protein
MSGTIVSGTIVSGSIDLGGFGGGISSNGTSLILRHVTLTENDAAGYGGGGIYSTSATDLENSIVALNSSSFGGPDIDSVSLVRLSGQNFIGDNSDSGIAATPGFIGTSASPLDPKLTPIDNLGGNTPVALPLPGSPVIDASSGSSATIDQRGFARVGIPDIGAAENRGNPDLGLIWNSDWDGDGNRFGIEHVLKTDPQVSDAGSSQNFSVSESSEGGQPTISFGHNPDMIPGANWELVRTSDFVTFRTIGTYDGFDLALIDSVDFEFTSEFFKFTDQNPPPDGAFYFLKVDFE